MSVLIPHDRVVFIDFQVGRPDGITWENLTPYLKSATVSLGDVASVGTGSAGVDGVVRQLSFTLRNDGAHSFAPRDRASAWNNFGGAYAPLLWSNRECVLRVAIKNPGETPAAEDWVPLFYGILGASIRVDSRGAEVRAQGWDLARRLQRAYIETARIYGSEAGVPVEAVMQQILDDNGFGSVSIYCPISKGFLVKEYAPEFVSVWQALQRMAIQIGWFLGYRYDPGAGAFRLTLMEPPRGKNALTADFRLTHTDDIYLQELDSTDDHVRNAVTVYYKDGETGEVKGVLAEDAASIAEYGRLPMAIGISDTEMLKTAAEAEDMATAALADLKDQFAATRINMPLLPAMDLFAGLVIQSPRVSSTEDFYGVESVEHRIEVSDDGRLTARTEVVATGKVIGAHGRWIAMQTMPGFKPVSGSPITQVPPDTPTNLTATPGPGKVVRLAWSASSGLDVRYMIWRKPGNHPGDPSGAIPIATEFGLQHIDSTGSPGEQYTWYVRAVDRHGHVSSLFASAVATVPQTEPDPTAPASLADIALSAGADEPYIDAQGIWRTRITLHLHGIPADPVRAYIQIKARQHGASQYWLEDQLFVESGEASVTIDELSPGVAYDFLAVPMSAFAVPGASKALDNYIAMRDTTPPATPTVAPSVVAGIKQLMVICNATGDADVAAIKIRRQSAPAEYDAANKRYIVPAVPEWSDWVDVADVATTAGALVSWVDSGASAINQCFRYSFLVEDGSGNQSDWSPESTAHIPAAVEEHDLGDVLSSRLVRVQVRQAIQRCKMNAVANLPTFLSPGIGRAINIDCQVFGADECVGGLAISGGFSTFPASDAFDDNNDTAFYSLQKGAAANGVAYIGYDFGVGVVKTIHGFRFLQGSMTPNSYVTSIRIQYSMDGVNWFDVITENVIPDVDIYINTPPITARCIRFLANSAIVGSTRSWEVDEIEMFTAVGAPLICALADGMDNTIGARDWLVTVDQSIPNAWNNLPPAVTIVGVSRTETTGICVCSGAHGLPVGAEVTLLDISTPGWTGPWIITRIPLSDRFEFTVPSSLTVPVTLGVNPRACPTVFLLVARDALTGEISFPYTLLPPLDDPTRPLTPVEDQHWFDTTGYVMHRYDGAAWVAVQRLPVGECVVDTAGIVQYTCYAPLARYDSGWIDIVANENYPGNHGIGTIPQDEITILARAADGTIARVRYFDYASNAGQGVILTALTRKSYVLHTASLSTSVVSASWGGAGVTNKAAVQARIIMKRGY